VSAQAADLRSLSASRRAASLIKDENFFLSEHGFKMLWERFVTAMNSVGLPSKIVVARLEKQRDASRNHCHAP
jgi:hypothetical protein